MLYINFYSISHCSISVYFVYLVHFVCLCLTAHPTVIVTNCGCILYTYVCLFVCRYTGSAKKMYTRFNRLYMCIVFEVELSLQYVVWCFLNRCRYSNDCKIIWRMGHSMSSEPYFQHFWTWPSRIFFKFGSSHVSLQIVKNLNFQIFVNCTFQVTVNWKQPKSSFFGSCAVKKNYYYS